MFTHLAGELHGQVWRLPYEDGFAFRMWSATKFFIRDQRKNEDFHMVKTMPFAPSPSHHHFNRRYEPFPVMDGKHGIVLPILMKLNEDVGLCMFM